MPIIKPERHLERPSGKILTIEDVKKDFRYFLMLMWEFLRLPPPTPIQLDIAAFLQYGPKREVINAFRGVGKSWITSVFCIWCWLNDPQLRIMVVSASKERADSFSIFTKRLISEVPILRFLQPRRGTRDSNIAFDVGPAEADHSPSLKSVGITGQLTGSRADIIVPDDIETPKNSYTTVQREKLSELVKEFDAVLKPLPSSRIVYLGTQQTEDSLYNVLPERGYTQRIWPSEYPDTKTLEAYGEALAPFIRDKWSNEVIGKPTDPKRFNEFDLAERKVSYGKVGYALQFMLNTSLSDAERYPLKLSDLIVTSLDREVAPSKIIWCKDTSTEIKDIECVGFRGDCYYRGKILPDTPYQEYQATIMAVDPSGRGKDETGYAIISYLNGQLFVHKAGGLPGGYDNETLTKLASMAKDYNVNKIIVESNFGDGMYSKLLQQVLTTIYPCHIEEVRHHTQKEKRIIDTLEPVMAKHKLIFDEDVIRHDLIPAEDRVNFQMYMLFYQLTHITDERGALAHDDRLDALAIGVNYWVEHMANDADKALEDLKEQLMYEELEKYMESTIGGSFETADNFISNF